MALIETFEIFSSCRTRISIQFSQLSNWGTFFSRCRWCFSFLATKIRNTRSWMHVSRSQHRANQRFSDELGGLGDEPARINKKKGKIEKYLYHRHPRESKNCRKKHLKGFYFVLTQTTWCLNSSAKSWDKSESV